MFSALHDDVQSLSVTQRSWRYSDERQRQAWVEWTGDCEHKQFESEVQLLISANGTVRWLWCQWTWTFTHTHTHTHTHRAPFHVPFLFQGTCYPEHFPSYTLIRKHRSQKHMEIFWRPSEQGGYLKVVKSDTEDAAITRCSVCVCVCVCVCKAITFDFSRSYERHFHWTGFIIQVSERNMYVEKINLMIGIRVSTGFNNAFFNQVTKGKGKVVLVLQLSTTPWRCTGE